MSIEEYGLEYRKNISSVILNIIKILRPIDILLLETQFKINNNHFALPYLKKLNDHILAISIFFQLPLIDWYKLLGDDENKYLAENDPIHQSPITSIFIAEEILKMNFSIVSSHYLIHRRT